MFLVKKLFLLFIYLTGAGMLSAEANKKVLIIAHRGASSQAPENTISAINKALDIGVDIVEIDVHQTKDGVVVVIHDETVNRTTNGKGKIRDYTFDQIRRLDAGGWFSEQFAGEKIPSLDEVMQTVAGKARLLIEIKRDDSCYPGIEKNIAEMINRYNAAEWCIIQSFESRALQNIKNINPAIEIHKLVTSNIPLLPLHVDHSLKWGSIYKYNDVASINPYFKTLSKNKVNRIHRKGKKVFTWTVDKEEDMIKAVEMEVDGIITNRPDVLKKILKR